MSEFEWIALYYTSHHWVNDMEISMKYITSPFFWTWGHLFKNNNFIRIHAPYLDGGIHWILENKVSQMSNLNKNLLFIDVTQSIWTGWNDVIDEIFLDESYSHISAIILLRQAWNIQTEILIINNANASNPILEVILEKISQPYKII
jgi:hypothetical protein